jgi:hypothetical protein
MQTELQKLRIEREPTPVKPHRGLKDGPLLGASVCVLKHNGNAEINSGLVGGENGVLSLPADLKDGDMVRVKGRT